MSIDKEKLYYTKEHEWLRLEGEFAYIGITHHAQSELGDIIFVEFPESGDVFDLMDVFGTIEAVKTVADLFTPIRCEVVEINDDLEDNPEKINSNPYDDGWLIKVKVSNHDDINLLLSHSEYEKMITNG